jgi:hypothetical protein
MSEMGTLRFLPWMRRGIARSISELASEGAPTSAAATFEVSVVVGDGSGVGDSAPVRQTIAIRGPGDVVGLLATQIARTDPVDGTQDFEPNYFPAVELVTPDLPWMFTPAAPGADDKLVPWLALVVVRDDGDNRVVTKSGAPLRTLSVADATAELPKLAEAWAWAHVQTSADLDSTPVKDAYEAQPEAFLARLLCPRRLDENTAYLACVVPTFEDGRRAGLGLAARDPAAIDVSDPDWWKAWTDTTRAIELPVYHAFSFRTGPEGDFEQLVRRLVPRELPVGLVDFDIGAPGTSKLPEPGVQKLVSWKGALVSASAVELTPDADHRDEFLTQMRSIVNEGLGSGSEPAAGERYDPLVHDPVVGPPAYGALAVGEDEVPEPVLQAETDGPRHRPLWLGQANLDPIHRSVAGLGAEVVRRNQEALMASAWRQASPLPEINRLVNHTRLAAEVAEIQKLRQLVGLSDARVLSVTAPANRRLRTNTTTTVRNLLAATSLPKGMTSSAFTRIGRPGGPVGRAMRGTSERSRANPARSTLAKCVQDLESSLRYIHFTRPSGAQIAVETVNVGVPSDATTTARLGRSRAAPSTTANASPGLTRTGAPLDLEIGTMPTTFHAGTTWALATEPTIAKQIAITGVDELRTAATEVLAAIRPTATLSRKLASRITAPGEPFANDVVPAALSATPQFPEPAYELLRRMDPEFLLPGVGEIPDNTVGLTYVNAAFVEAFLLGANGELAREFLWREYPVVLTETWLRTFWDSLPKQADEPEESEAAAIEDIGQVSTWTGSRTEQGKALGEHQTGYGADGTLVLVIRGELLRKYPDTTIYASKARWNPDERTDTDGSTIPVESFREEDSSAPERKDPLFVGSLDANTVFLGFELDSNTALGDVDDQGVPVPGGDAGWFFVFEEPPFGPRFGLDIGKPWQAGTNVDEYPTCWANVSWHHQVEHVDDLPALTHAEATGRLAGSAMRTYDDPAIVPGGKFEARWGKHAAAMARITLQRPVRMLVHASAMLPEVEA